MTIQVITKADAKAQKLRRFYTGLPCKLGHVAERLTSNGRCVICSRLSVRRSEKRNKKKMLEWRRKRLKIRNQEINEARRLLYAKDIERRRALQRAQHARRRARRNKYQNGRRATDVNFRIGAILRVRIHDLLRGRKKAGSAVRDMDCSIDELRMHIERQFSHSMRWDNWGKVWQLDHIRPLASFDLTDRAQFLAACHYSNLQPLAVDEHREKTEKDKELWQISARLVQNKCLIGYSEEQQRLNPHLD
jgi:hypothetical protein